MPFDGFDQAEFGELRIVSKKTKNKPRRYEVTCEKPAGAAHEDGIWLLFDGMDAELLSASRLHVEAGKLYARHNLKLLGSATREIDVIARLGKYVFFVEAKDEQNYANAKTHLDRLAQLQNSLKEAADALSPGSEAVPVLWYSTTQMPDQALVDAARDRRILLLTGGHLDYYEEMLDEKLLARHSFIRDQMKGERFWHSDLYYPAVRVQISGGKEFYVGVGKPGELVQVCRVDRRSPIKEQSYQRLIKVDKVRNARTYLETFQRYIESKGIFGNSILLVSDGQIGFELIAPEKDRGVGFLRIPAVYGCLSVVDGQHRLFSYVGTERQANRELPFVLFPTVSDEFARAMFVSINDNQQKIPSELLWDILADLEPPEDMDHDDKEYRKHVIARVARGLALSATNPLGGAVAVYGLPEDFKEEPHITLTTVCASMEKLQFFKLARPSEPHFSLRITEEKVGQEAERILVSMDALLLAWLMPIKTKMAVEWKAKKQGRVFNNNALAVHFYALNMISQAGFASGAKTDEEILKYVTRMAPRYLAFWQKQVESDDQADEQRLNKSLSSEGARKDFAFDGAEYVLDRTLRRS